MCRHFPFLFLLSLISVSCGGLEYGKVSYSDSPKVINVSHYDPKEKQRSGRSYTPLNQAALRANGAHGLIARCAKGPTLDTKCADFLVGAERQGMLLGSYYYLLPDSDPHYHAHRFINRLRSIKASRGLRTDRILLVADIHTDCSISRAVYFVSEIKSITGKYPVIYIENGPGMRARLNAASAREKSILRQCPYWLALYSDKHAGLETPLRLTQASGIWSNWVMWQYGGVWWKNGRSVPHNYHRGSWHTPKYFGNLDRPIERSGFNGSTSELYSFWNSRAWKW
ncbi:hypothetical protein Rhal01_01529 [Rubritalea halochordaticola]|uniref:Glycoside hydrolase family 25 n=1 Tax=Rubritalea halochordaticola TaxID=714537 RepID=A0ABP9V084_9BACT